MPTDQAPRNRLFVQSFKLICGLNFISNRATAFCADVYRVRSRRISIISAAGRTEASAPCGKTARTTKAAPSRTNLARARPLKALANFIYTLASVCKLAQSLRSAPKWGVAQSDTKSKTRQIRTIYALKMHLKFRPKASAGLIKPRAVGDSLVACDTTAVAAF